MLLTLNIILIGSVALFVVFPLFYSYGNIYRPRLPIRGTPQEDGLKFEAVSFSTSDGNTIRGWFLFGKPGSPLILACHGIGTNREDLRDVSEFLCKSGFNVLAFDFRAHGESGGGKTTFGFTEALDIQAAVQYAEEKFQGSFHGVGIYAISMGSAATLFASQNLPAVGAFVFDSPYARLSEVMDFQFHSFPLPLDRIFSGLAKFYGSLLMGIPAAKISPEDYVRHLDHRPVLVFHGDQDALIPISQGQKLFEKIPGPKEFVLAQGAAHVQSRFLLGNAYDERVVEFFRRNLGK